jgi:hypothetical protein
MSQRRELMAQVLATVRALDRGGPEAALDALEAAVISSVAGARMGCADVAYAMRPGPDSPLAERGPDYLQGYRDACVDVANRIRRMAQ